MKKPILRADLLFLLTAVIWGLAFVAQRVGMDYMGPLAFNFARFGLGSLVLAPLVWRQKKKGLIPHCGYKEIILGGTLASMFLLLASTLQQVGLVSTEAGKAGFITGLYVIFVPFLGLFLGQSIGWKTWLGAVLAVVGLYFLSVTTKFTIRRGDLYILISAVAWAFHVQTIGRFTGRVGALRLSLIQFSVTSALSLLAALIVEDIDILTWSGALIPILYAGALSVGVGYTLQVVAQKDAPPTHAAIILSLESVFALVGGWLLLGEILTPRAILGCALMLVGMWVSQISRDTI